MRPAIIIGIGTNLWKKYGTSKYTVTGETSRSWLVRFKGQAAWEDSIKLPKAKFPDEWFLDEREWRRFEFAKDHRYAIAKCIERAGTDVVIAVAKLIGFAPCKCGHIANRHQSGKCIDCYRTPCAAFEAEDLSFLEAKDAPTEAI